MKKRLIVTLILLAVVFISGCTAVSMEHDKSKGGVIICGIDFPCGSSDDVCPEEYGAECKVEDPDCV